MFRVYARGRWAAFLSPNFPYASHILNIYHDGNHTLPNPQQSIGWSQSFMWNIVEDYVNERDAEDQEKTK